ncbi:MAG TPA: hypothetical protein VLF62_05455 [Candidatus Saccharimonadales bacterium]|nr:hypothetical protein [Candidatus Saccharimonadales bacterium]
MSELGAAYYRGRADAMGLPIAAMPAMLRTGEAVLAVTLPERRAATTLTSSFRQEVASLSGFVTEGVPFVLEAANGQAPSANQWQRMKQTLRPRPRYAPLGRFAERNMRPAMQRGIPLWGAVYIDAIARREVPEDVMLRMMSNNGSYLPSPRAKAQEWAQAFIVTRAVVDDGTTINAHFTTVWAEYSSAWYRDEQSYLGMRYLGAPLLAREVAKLPELVMPPDMPAPGA